MYWKFTTSPSVYSYPDHDGEGNLFQIRVFLCPFCHQGGHHRCSLPSGLESDSSAGEYWPQIVANGASANRKLFRMHGKEGLVFKTHNPFACPSEYRCLFFISDPPHLICTTEALQIKGTASSTNPVRLLPLSKQYCSSSTIIHIVVYGMITQHKNSGRCLSAESAHHTLRYKYS